MRNAAATFTDWLDHVSGEQPIAHLDETTFGKGNEGILLTDRRPLAYTSDGNKHERLGELPGRSTDKSLIVVPVHGQ